MKAQILKIAGVKSEKEFYKKYPSEEAFMKKHGKEFKKAQTGAAINASQVRQPAFKPLNYQDQFDEVDKMLTGSTAAQRQELALKQQAASKDSGGGGGFDIAGLIKLAGGAMQGGEGMGDIAGAEAARYGADIHRAQFGGNYDLGKSPDFSVNANQGFSPKQNSFSMQAPKFNAYDPQGDQAGGKMAQGIFSGARSVADSPFSAPGDTLSKIGGAVSQFAGPVGSIISGIGQLAGAKKARKAAEQARDVSKVSLKAAESVDVDARRQQSENIAKQREAQMPVNTGEEFFPIYGVGTNVLARNGLRLQGGGEIQNTFDPNDIYMDSGYEPLNDSNIKQYAQGGRLYQMQDGGGTPWGAISQKATGIGQSLMGGQNAGGGIGSTIGSTLGMVGGPIGSAIGGFVGGIAGNLLDTNSKKMKKAQDATQRNMQGMANANMAKGIQAQNQSYMKDGGWVSNDWTPQVIATFGEHKLSDLLQPPHDADMLRAGGHLRSYTPPSDRAMETYEDGGEIQSYGLGGQLKTHWGGGAETISRNPYLPGTGETVMFRGKSHEEYSPNGETGIGVTYGGNPVEVERGEPMVELEEGGTIDPETGEVQKSGVVFGNLQIPNQYIDMLGDKNAKGKKFKNYVADLSKIEEKQNTIIDKSSKELSALDPINSFDKLKLTALQANIQGANMKLKELADKKINAASLQNAINDTAEERGLVADDLARGKVKVDKEAQKQSAKFGGKFTQAQTGWYNDNPIGGAEDYGQVDMQGGELNEVVITPKTKLLVEPEERQSYMWGDEVEQIEEDDMFDYYMGDDESDTPSNKKTSTKSGKKSDWWDKATLFANATLPYFRPSDVEGLDMAQLYPEMFAMATNQVSPVWTQSDQYNPLMDYEINRQSAKNDLIAQTRAAQRQVGYNPAMQAAIAAQAYEPMQKLNEADFIANQEIKNRIRNENRSMFDQSKKVNFERFDNQYKRQQEALANTKATTLAALNSISDKYAKNKLEKNTLATYENMYNYRFGPNFRAQNMNPLAQFDTDYKGASAEELEAMSVLKKAQDKKEAAAAKKTATARNGSIVKSYKNI